ncbi:NAD(P) transhydrogenase subunit alpha (plasmid) [Fulvitalea axinellae]|uniref:proton-translocating NAD(P)(+) transhydrogenase n=1 Tax=Fulvitalea axinellae TaxID=1182444 RepID=A0AAU9CP20_9BACT|nr:NAD(P) transhydrogenase subunit alpha [Fulvitalea axinellae]
MLLGILKESDDRRVAISPESVKKFKDKFEVKVETGAGANAQFSDKDYTAAGAEATDRKTVLSTADLVFSIDPINQEEAQSLKPGAILICQFAPFNDDKLTVFLAEKGITAFSLDMVPRTTLAQSMDVLSSMASIAGYRAVLKATDFLPRYMPMLTTAAGTIPPAKVLILGAGVAGLQAIATARRLGAVVEAFDTRAASKEEVESLGAKFVEVEGATDDKAAGGYAVEQSDDYKKKQAALIADKAEKADIVITTALLRGRPAPTLVPKTTLDRMKAGSVVIDMASVTGGNCEVTKDKETVVYNGVSVVGHSNLSEEVAQHASILYGKNIENYLKLLWNEQGELDFENEIVAKSCITHNKENYYAKNA